MKFDMLRAVFCGLALIAAAIFFGSGSSSAVAHAPGQRAVSIDWANETQEWVEKTKRWIREVDLDRENSLIKLSGLDAGFHALNSKVNALVELEKLRNQR